MSIFCRFLSLQRDLCTLLPCLWPQAEESRTDFRHTMYFLQDDTLGPLALFFTAQQCFRLTNGTNSRGNYHNSICCLSSPDDLTALIALILDIRGQYRFNSTGALPCFLPCRWHCGRHALEEQPAPSCWRGRICCDLVSKALIHLGIHAETYPGSIYPPPIHTYLKGHDPFAVKQSMSQSGSSGRI